MKVIFITCKTCNKSCTARIDYTEYWPSIKDNVHSVKKIENYSGCNHCKFLKSPTHSSQLLYVSDLHLRSEFAIKERIVLK